MKGILFNMHKVWEIHIPENTIGVKFFCIGGIQGKAHYKVNNIWSKKND